MSHALGPLLHRAYQLLGVASSFECLACGQRCQPEHDDCPACDAPLRSALSTRPNHVSQLWEAAHSSSDELPELLVAFGELRDAFWDQVSDAELEAAGPLGEALESFDDVVDGLTPGEEPTRRLADAFWVVLRLLNTRNRQLASADLSHNGELLDLKSADP